jgi:hypothetical protein
MSRQYSIPAIVSTGVPKPAAPVLNLIGMCRTPVGLALGQRSATPRPATYLWADDNTPKSQPYTLRSRGWAPSLLSRIAACASELQHIWAVSGATEGYPRTGRLRVSVIPLISDRTVCRLQTSTLPHTPFATVGHSSPDGIPRADYRILLIYSNALLYGVSCRSHLTIARRSPSPVGVRCKGPNMGTDADSRSHAKAKLLAGLPIDISAERGYWIGDILGVHVCS